MDVATSHGRFGQTVRDFIARRHKLLIGGYKQSGWGREMGYEAIELYTETKAVVAKL